MPMLIIVPPEEFADPVDTAAGESPAIDPSIVHPKQFVGSLTTILMDLFPKQRQSIKEATPLHL
jgi:hypothetical protein